MTEMRLKKAELSEEICIRVRETWGEELTETHLEFGAEILSAQQTNGLEDLIAPAPHSGNRLMVSLQRYQPATFTAAVQKLNQASLNNNASKKIQAP